MSWWRPWRRDEDRQSGGGYTDAIVAAIEATASQHAASVTSTAAVEAVAGLLSRAFAGAEVEGPGWARDACNPVWLAQVGRSLVREGASLSVIDMKGGGEVELIPAAFNGISRTWTPAASEADQGVVPGARVSRPMDPVDIIDPTTAPRPTSFRPVGHVSGLAVSRAGGSVVGGADGAVAGGNRAQFGRRGRRPARTTYPATHGPRRRPGRRRPLRPAQGSARRGTRQGDAA